MNPKTSLILLISTLVFFTNSQAENSSEKLVNFKSLTIELAHKAAWAALKDCRKKGYSVAVAVVDRSGIVQALLRDRFAGPHTPDTATRKAWTVVSFRQSTGQLATLLAEKKIPKQIPHITNALLVGGGLKIEANGALIAAIGVSGAPPGVSELKSIDGACAKAGIDAIQETLDFSD